LADEGRQVNKRTSPEKTKKKTQKKKKTKTHHQTQTTAKKKKNKKKNCFQGEGEATKRSSPGSVGIRTPGQTTKSDGMTIAGELQQRNHLVKIRVPGAVPN